MEVGSLFALLITASFFTVESQRIAREANAGCPGGIVRLDVDGDPKEIVSPLHPNYYPSEVSCKWRLAAPAGVKINITSTVMSVENSPGCSFDKLIIYDGDDARKEDILGRFCGNLPFSVVTSANEALLVFTSDMSYEGIGFTLQYSRSSNLPTERISKINRVPDCNRTFAESPGYITSPNYPLPSGDKVNCVYKFTAPEGQVIQLVFKDFHVEKSNFCKFDRLDIFDGPDEDSEWLDTYCGSGRPPSIRSTGNHLFLVFTTDESYTQGGFNFTFTFMESGDDPLGLTMADGDCSGELKEEGIVTSPSFPQLYPNNKLCLKVIRAPEGKHVKVMAEEFNIEESGDCKFDALVIEDGSSPDSPSIGSYCGNQLMANTSITSTFDSLRLLFRSDGSVSERGFRISFSFVRETDSIKCYLGCLNGGKCVLQSGGPMCDCPPPYLGNRCESTPRDCGERPCLNGGTCSQFEDGFSCFCQDEFTGEYCDKDVELKPLEFVKVTMNQTNLPVQEEVYLQCRVNRKDAKIQWLFDDDIMLETADSKSLRLNIDVYEGGVLHIRRLTETNSGKYTCVADDGRSQIQQHTWISIDKPCFLEFTVTPQNTTEIAGNTSHLFKCDTTDDNAHYAWEKDGDPITEDQRYKVIGNNKNFLVINDLEITDSGIYTCVVLDVGNCVRRASAWLTVVDSGSNYLTCGRPKLTLPGGVMIGPRVTSGRQALEGSYPWFALLYDEIMPGSFCGGSILNERWIITAAHCLKAVSKITRTVIFNEKTTKIFVGSNNCRGDKGVMLSVEKFLIHPWYNHKSRSFNHDIALIKVKERIRFTSKVIPVCLKPLSFIEPRFLRGQEFGYVAGCGLLSELGTKPVFLTEVKLPIRSKYECHKSPDHSSNIADNMICAGYATANRGDACGGDSGGGFVFKSDDQFTLVGIVSWGLGCDRANSYGYYTNAGRYFKWIHDNIN